MADAPLAVRTFDGAADAAFDSYVATHPATTYSATARWTRVLRDHYGLRPWCALAVRGDAPVGALTLLVNHRMLRGRHALTCPLASSGGGFVANDPEATAALLEAAEMYCVDAKLRYAQLRLVELPPGLEDAAADRWVRRDDYLRFMLDLSGGRDGLWRDVFRDKTRNQIRKAEKHGFAIDSGPEALRPFVEVLQAGTRELGAPSPAHGLFEHARAEFGDDMRFIVIRAGEEAVAGAVLFRHGDTIANPWAVTLRAWRPTSVNVLLYWHAAQWGIDLGCTAFDLGRSEKGTGTHDFKRRLGGIPEPITYYYHRHRARSLPAAVPAGPVAEMIRRCWRHTPTFLTRRLCNRLMKELI